MWESLARHLGLWRRARQDGQGQDRVMPPGKEGRETARGACSKASLNPVG